MEFILVVLSWYLNGLIIYLFGIDVLGWDLFLWIMYGCWVIFGISLLVVIIVMVVGVFIGIIVGMLSGVCLSVVNYLLDVLMVIFILLIVIIIVGILGSGLVNSMWVIILVFIL